MVSLAQQLNSPLFSGYSHFPYQGYNFSPYYYQPYQQYHYNQVSAPIPDYNYVSAPVQAVSYAQAPYTVGNQFHAQVGNISEKLFLENRFEIG